VRVESARRERLGIQAPPIQPAARERVVPLSFAQQRLWFLDRMEPGLTVYSMPSAVRLAGTLDLAALARTLSEIVRRHEVLRTTFEVADDEPVQVVAAPRSAALPLVDLQALPEEARAAQADELVARAARAPFDLSRG